MKSFQSFGALARQLERVALRVPETHAALMRAGANTVAEDAKERIGHYQQGWEQLAPSTVAEKTRKGFAGVALPGGDGGDNPLLRTGDLRDSITQWATPSEFVVGSADPVMLYQEMGTPTIPPRPVLEPALKHMTPFILEVGGKAIEKTLAGEA